MSASEPNHHQTVRLEEMSANLQNGVFHPRDPIAMTDRVEKVNSGGSRQDLAVAQKARHASETTGIFQIVNFHPEKGEREDQPADHPVLLKGNLSGKNFHGMKIEDRKTETALSRVSDALTHQMKNFQERIFQEKAARLTTPLFAKEVLRERTMIARTLSKNLIAAR